MPSKRFAVLRSYLNNLDASASSSLKTGSMSDDYDPDEASSSAPLTASLTSFSRYSRSSFPTTSPSSTLVEPKIFQDFTISTSFPPNVNTQMTVKDPYYLRKWDFSTTRHYSWFEYTTSGYGQHSAPQGSHTGEIAAIVVIPIFAIFACIGCIAKARRRARRDRRHCCRHESGTGTVTVQYLYPQNPNVPVFERTLQPIAPTAPTSGSLPREVLAPSTLPSEMGPSPPSYASVMGGHGPPPGTTTVPVQPQHSPALFPPPPYTSVD